MKNSLYLWGLIGLVVLAVGLGIFSMFAGVSSNSGELAGVSVSDITRGSREAKVTVIEYSDFQCPACRAYAPVVKELVDSSNGDVLLVYRHFPLPQHGNARITGIAAEAAGRQGKFWEMADMIFARQDDWAASKNAKDILEGYARNLGLDMARFAQDLEDPAIAEKIQNDLESGQKAGVNSTPTFFVNGVKIKNPRNLDEFKAVVSSYGSTK